MNVRQRRVRLLLAVPLVVLLAGCGATAQQAVGRLFASRLPGRPR